ncbi:3-phosphoshikimate 1-carboxyvinyltransferase [Halobacterium salinarum]|nr:3-phosphoshikimate 1-carboxyvinyltransferase [Halobacterium salinarum]B0R558.1 RecName: Full=3-phosphoshikimate 1-carboxyvinyltransferase; AltName: Full=5-enolpyruvylshikimate-3-phosphate synthase; Short=EPSP synthase; Short=EPSPS [Halobacterium salinarum R1]MBB6090283.1 3-phosphoshikimate 1-carboxyvinyltransferase [Halobacterium salinarum]MDL0118996.1 3-phosphoshikimate 1-carboxyvinyltransferase [Halobacterium salinarum]MDL0131140.1 3-phosphoshikimate 1-carboxyvinyltransferase [Halobacteriu
MHATVSPSRVRGRARAPPSKSYTHRALLAAGYADGETVVRDPLVSADTRATARAVELLGGAAARENGDWVVTGFGSRPAIPDAVIDCANSGTTMRLVTAAAALADGTTVLTGDESLRARPHGPLLDALSGLGGTARSTRGNGQAPLVVDGPVSGGSVALPGDVSSQFVTALLMAGAVTETGIETDLTTELKSAPYVDITLDVLDAFGVGASETAAGYRVRGGQAYAPSGAEYAVPGDFSSASYLLAAGALAAADGAAVVVEGMHPSAQGDAAIVDVLERMGADIDWDTESGVITVQRSELSGVEVGVADTPDLLPTIAVLGAAADGTTRITDAEHVRYKETDRVAAMAESLSKLGASVEERPDELVVRGGDTELSGASVDGRGDHRLVMALAVAGLVADGETTIAGSEHVDVSFPDFFEVLAGLGADTDG